MHIGRRGILTRSHEHNESNSKPGREISATDVHARVLATADETTAKRMLVLGSSPCESFRIEFPSVNIGGFGSPQVLRPKAQTERMADLRPTSTRSSSDGIPIDWGTLGPLRLRAKQLAEGVYAGSHRSARKGPGVEFGGHRPYVPGDDLRFFDRRALLKHDRMMVREFETETDRALWLCVDATASMAYRSAKAPGAKLAYGALIGAALGRVALSSGDPVGLAWIGGRGALALPATGGREAFDRVVGALESITAAGDAKADAGAMERALSPIARRARRGSIIVLISDLVDLPERALSAFTALGTNGRSLVVVRVLDPMEVSLGFSGHVRLRAMEGSAVVETDADEVRATYQAKIHAIAERYAEELSRRGGRFVDATTDKPAADVVRAVVRAVSEARA